MYLQIKKNDKTLNLRLVKKKFIIIFVLSSGDYNNFEEISGLFFSATTYSRGGLKDVRGVN